ncbi:response regulator [Priestia flexa]|uniref:response regulator n=1 Tax=Priestia flexa TaxID=86664 RepID=UPI00289271F2|nr:response regulator [Priestia flexa]MDT2047978.1 response regulator [Priestia flexa]
MTKSQWKVLVIEDDLMVQEVNKQFIEQVEGFVVTSVASNGVEGLRMIEKDLPDLIIIDMYMPHQDGITTLQKIRSKGYQSDVIAVTAASDSETIKRVLQYGAVDYIMKPFKFERMKQALENYRQRQNKLGKSQIITQDEVDTLLFKTASEKSTMLPKGLNTITLAGIRSYLHSQTDPISAEEVAEGMGIARVTARRYLEYLDQEKEVELYVEYGRVGRPVNRYLLQQK